MSSRSTSYALTCDTDAKMDTPTVLFLRMGGVALQCKANPEGPPVRVSAEKFIALVNSGELSWPTLRDSDIDDRSKADWTTKGIALLQILYFLAQLVGRAVQHLPVTTLELFTLGMVVCAAVTYAAWWGKPFDVRTPIVVEGSLRDIDASDAVDRIHILRDTETPTVIEQRDPWLTRYMYNPTILLVFGAAHLVGWQFHFSSSAERVLWRLSSVGCTVVPMVSVALARLANSRAWRRSKYGESRALMVGSGALISFVYMPFRLYMFTEMFVSLRDAPVGVYETPEWSQYFPSFG
jgi:hypothetical protein